MFSVEMTLMPAASSSSTSCQRFSFREPGTFVWASSSTSATWGRRARTASTSISSKTPSRYSARFRGTTSRSPTCSAVLRPPVRLDEADDDVLAVLAATPAFVEHREGLADAGRCAEVDTQLSSRHGYSVPLGARAVEGEVELEHVDARLAEEAERAVVGVLADEREHVIERRARERARPAAPGGARSRARCAGRARSRRRSRASIGTLVRRVVQCSGTQRAAPRPRRADPRSSARGSTPSSTSRRSRRRPPTGAGGSSARRRRLADEA